MIVRRMIAGIIALSLAAPSIAQDKAVPYWASISSGKAMVRKGPGRNYPGLWLYQRRDLPVRVLKVYDNWRLIEDPDGAKGWMLVSLMSSARTFMVKAEATAAIYEKPTDLSRKAFLAEPGVVGRIEKCDGTWCRVAIGKKRGWMEQRSIYGTDPDEAVDN